MFEEQKVIICKFNPKENVRITTEGYEGDSCLKAIDEISKALPEGMKLTREEVTMTVMEESGLELDETSLDRLQNTCG